MAVIKSGTTTTIDPVKEEAVIKPVGSFMPIRRETIINTRADLEAIIAKVTFDNSILNQFKFRFAFDSHYDSKGVEIGWEIYCEFYRPDINTGQMGWGRGRNEIINRGAYEGSAVKTMFVLIDLLLRHEAMEGFKYEGEQIFNPHHSVPELCAISKVHQTAMRLAK